MFLSHYSKKPIDVIYSVEQDKIGAGCKPLGVWVSVDGEDDWSSWCQGEGIYLDRLKFRYRIYLSTTANLLHLKTVDDIDLFTTEYGVSGPRLSLPKARPVHHIKWREVAKKYQGIIICPYQWSKRVCTSCMWYYAWDCASGCIWDAAAVERIEEVNLEG